MKKMFSVFVLSMFMLSLVSALYDPNNTDENNTSLKNEVSITSVTDNQKIQDARNRINEKINESNLTEEQKQKIQNRIDESLNISEQRLRKAIQTKNRLRIHENINLTNKTCPEQCECHGVTVKCQLQNGSRQMTVYAGKSGNTIIQVQNTNMSTNVTLYHHDGRIFATFKGNHTRELNITPDQVKEKIRQRTKARLENQSIELQEDGNYSVEARKQARLFFIIPVKEKIHFKLNSENGEILRTKNPWWGFLARDVSEK